MLTPQQIEQISFNTKTFGGYDTVEVDEILETLTEDYVTLYKENAPKGDFVLVVGGAAPKEKAAATPEDAAARVAELVESGMSRKDAIKQTAKELDLPKNVVYDAALQE